MPAKHRPDPLIVQMRQPKLLSVLTNPEHVHVALDATEQHVGEMREPIIQRREPLSRPQIVKLVDGVDLPPKGSKELPRRNFPRPIEPRSLLPTRKAMQNARILGVIEMVVANPRGDEPRLTFS